MFVSFINFERLKEKEEVSRDQLYKGQRQYWQDLQQFQLEVSIEYVAELSHCTLSCVMASR